MARESWQATRLECRLLRRPPCSRLSTVRLATGDGAEIFPSTPRRTTWEIAEERGLYRRLVRIRLAEVQPSSQERVLTRRAGPLFSLSLGGDISFRLLLREYTPGFNIRRRFFHHFDKLRIRFYPFEIRLLLSVQGDRFAHDPAAISASSFRQFIEKSL